MIFLEISREILLIKGGMLIPNFFQPIVHCVQLFGLTQKRDIELESAISQSLVIKLPRFWTI